MQTLLSSRRDGTPAELMASLLDVIGKTLGGSDPLHDMRGKWHNDLAELRPRIGARIAESSDPLRAALVMAARANVFDDDLLSEREMRDDLRKLGLRKESGEDEFAHSDYTLFQRELPRVRTLLFLHDSGPELIFDAELIRAMTAVNPELEVTCAVRVKPILMDATREDVQAAGLLDHPNVKAVVDPGIQCLGVLLNECSREFRTLIEDSDLVLAKGQAHYETLEKCGRTAYFLMRVKCPVMAKRQAARVGDVLFVRG